MRKCFVAACVVAMCFAAQIAKGEAASMKMHDKVTSYLTERSGEFDQISAERKELLGKIADYVKECRRQDRPARLVFICTQNSRRSHLGQI